MAVEYEIASDIAVISEVANTNQLAHVAKFYTGAVTYDDEASSKYATVTIGGKTQRVMLCIAVSGTATYDDVPSKYSTVSGHRCLNIVEPTGTETPEDVPSVYETVSVDGKNVRAIRCVLVNQTPVYDGNSNTCTFVDSGKTHTAQLVNVVSGGAIEQIVSGVPPLSLPDAVAASLVSLKAFGGCQQRNIPEQYTQVNYVTNTTATAISTGIMLDTAKKYEIEIRCRAVVGSWYMLQSRASGGAIYGLTGSSAGAKISAVWAGVLTTSAISRTNGNIIYVKATFDNGDVTLYVKDETAGTDDTATGTYSTSASSASTPVYLWGNANGDQVGINSDVYFARIKENDVTIMDYVPCRQSATAGFYDMVSGNFITATTPSDVTADGNTVPSPTTPMNIVCNNGVLKVSPNLFKSSDITTTTVFDVTLSVAADGTITADGTSSSQNYSQFVFPLSNPISEGTYTVSLYNSETLSAGSLVGFAINTTVGARGTALTTANNVKTITVGSGEVCNNVIIRIAGTADQFKFKIQIEKGDQGTTYRPYGQIYTDGTVETIVIKDDQNATVSTATCEDLLSVGTYTDEQEVISGGVTRKVGAVVFNGTESWSDGSSPNVFLVPVADKKPGKYESVCNYYRYSSTSQSGLTHGTFGMPGSGVNMFFKDDRFSTASGFATWLAQQYNAGTPVIVVYPLATETTETVTGQPMSTTEGDNIAEITQASMSGLELEATYMKQGS